jgi:hypothetical protein
MSELSSENPISDGGHVEIHKMLREFAGRNILMLYDLQEKLATAINTHAARDSSETRGKVLFFAQCLQAVGNVSMDHLAAAVMYFPAPQEAVMEP